MRTGIAVASIGASSNWDSSDSEASSNCPSLGAELCFGGSCAFATPPKDGPT